MKKVALVLFTVVFSATLFGQTKVPITGVKGFKFGMQREDVDRALEAVYGLRNMEKKRRETTLFKPEWGGVQIDYIDFDYLFNGKLYEVYFSKGFDLDDEKGGYNYFEYFKEVLDKKYGKQEIVEIDKSFVVYWSDFSNNTGISLNFEKAKSRGGYFRYYVSLKYIDFGLYSIKKKEAEGAF